MKTLALTWSALLLWLALLASGCVALEAADKLQGTDLLELAKRENAAGCVRGTVTGSHLGAAGVLYLWATWGTHPPDCSKVPQ